jgi:uncharacterized membrane protein YbaN (DUF454 family)
MAKLLRPVLLAVGFLSLATGIAGIFLPIVPTTPLLLLAAACFMRSSERMHGWLVKHPHFGIYIEGFLYGGGVPVRAKRSALLTLWPVIVLSCSIVVWKVETPALRFWAPVVMLVVASAVTVFILTRPTVRD